MVTEAERLFKEAEQQKLGDVGITDPLPVDVDMATILDQISKCANLLLIVRMRLERIEKAVGDAVRKR